MNYKITKVTRLTGAWRKGAVAGLSVVALSLFAVSARADINLVQNGGFEATTLVSPVPTNPSINGGGELGYNVNADNWTPIPYAILYFPGTADTTGENTHTANNPKRLWGPNDGGTGLTASSPAGGNFIGGDGDDTNGLGQGGVSQTIDNLIAGTQYTLSFYWAAAQEKVGDGSGADGITTESWHVTLGSQVFDTPTVTTPSHGFTPWALQTFTFTATDGSSELLSFVAKGTPPGAPPFVLLDGVSITATPEPGSVILMISVLGLMVAVGVRRSKTQAVKG